MKSNRKLAAVSRENHGEHTRTKISGNTVLSRMIKITWLKFLRKTTDNLAKGFRKMLAGKNRKHGALRKLDDFCPSPQASGQSGNVAVTHLDSTCGTHHFNEESSENYPILKWWVGKIRCPHITILESNFVQHTPGIAKMFLLIRHISKKFSS